MIINSLNIIIKDCIDEFCRAGTFGVIKKAYAYIKDPYQRIISEELKAWPVCVSKKRAVIDSAKNPLVKGFVTVIMPVYDRTWEVRESIESILSQTYPDFELILITDGSPLETMQIIDSYRKNPRVRVISFEESSGTAVRGRNAGIEAARGEFVAFQDSDDIAESERLVDSVSLLRETAADLVYGGWKILLEGKRKDVNYNDGDVIIPPEFSVRDIFRNNRICQSTVMARTAMFLDIGGYKPEMRFREDHELWLRAAYFGYRLAPVSKVLTTLRLNQGNNTLNFLDNDQQWYGMMLREYKNRGPLITLQDESP